MFKSVLILLAFIFSYSAHADFQWSGVYRVEANHINNSELDGEDRKKEYGLHHLVLKPKIVAADGLNIHGRLDILNTAAYNNSGLGSYFGSAPSSNPSGCTSVNRESCNAISQNQKADIINVTQLYLTYVHEFGSLIVGRAPLHFGLGITHNSGDGLFDHWMDTRDLFGYKIAIGNLYFLPMYGKLSEGTTIGADNDDITDYMLQVQYENPESGWDIGAFYWQRKAGSQANDTLIPDTATANNKDIDMTTINLYANKETDNFRFGFEGSMQTGDTGSSDTLGRAIEAKSFAAAFEMDWTPEGSHFDYNIRLGYITGDDASTTDKFEAYIFDRNYDVAFLMFNHQLGQGDFLRTGTNAVHGAPISTPDVEAMSNVYYLDLNASYHWGPKWTVDAGLTYASLNEDNNFDSNLGFELDLGMTFSPNKRLKWVNEIGLLFPGSAFEQDANGTYKSEFAYGITTKAAISF